MHQKAKVIFYALSMFVFGTGLFMFSPTNIPMFSIAWQQTIGDQPYFNNFELVFNGVSDFYDQASSQMVALLAQPDTDQDIIYVYSKVYHDFAQIFVQNKTVAIQNVELSIPVNFMTQEPLDNIVPDQLSVVKAISGNVSGTLTEQAGPVNSYIEPWVTMKDAVTGQVYCLSVYNDEVNKYLGACKKDSYQ